MSVEPVVTCPSYKAEIKPTDSLAAQAQRTHSSFIDIFWNRCHA